LIYDFKKNFKEKYFGVSQLKDYSSQ